MKTIEILTAVYNDKEVLTTIHKSIDEYSINLRSMDQLKRDTKDIETYIKEKYKISPTVFKKIVKAKMSDNSNVDTVIDELQLINDIAHVD